MKKNIIGYALLVSVSALADLGPMKSSAGPVTPFKTLELMYNEASPAKLSDFPSDHEYLKTGKKFTCTIGIVRSTPIEVISSVDVVAYTVKKSLPIGAVGPGLPHSAEKTFFRLGAFSNLDGSPEAIEKVKKERASLESKSYLELVADRYSTIIGESIFDNPVRTPLRRDQNCPDFKDTCKQYTPTVSHYGYRRTNQGWLVGKSVETIVLSGAQQVSYWYCW